MITKLNEDVTSDSLFGFCRQSSRAEKNKNETAYAKKLAQRSVFSNKIEGSMDEIEEVNNIASSDI